MYNLIALQFSFAVLQCMRFAGLQFTILTFYSFAVCRFKVYSVQLAELDDHVQWVSHSFLLWFISSIVISFYKIHLHCGAHCFLLHCGAHCFHLHCGEHCFHSHCGAHCLHGSMWCTLLSWINVVHIAFMDQWAVWEE